MKTFCMILVVTLMASLLSGCSNPEKEKSGPPNTAQAIEDISFTDAKDSTIMYSGIKFTRKQIMFEGKVEDSIYLGQRSDTIYALVGRYMDEKCLQSTVFTVLPSTFGDTTFVKVVDRGCHDQIPATYLGQYFEARSWNRMTQNYVRHVFKPAMERMRPGLTSEP